MDTQKQKSTINNLYLLLIVSTILSFVPEMTMQFFSAILLLVVLIAAYFYKARDHEDGLVYNHMTYMIGTIWIGTTFLVIGMVLAGTWLYLEGDHSIIHNTMMQIQGGSMVSEQSLNAVMVDYMMANRQLLILSSLVTIGPAVLYIVYRVANGFSRSIKGYRIANPKSWL